MKLFCMCSSVADVQYQSIEKTISCQCVTHTTWQSFLRKRGMQKLQPKTLDNNRQLQAAMFWPENLTYAI